MRMHFHKSFMLLLVFPAFSLVIIILTLFIEYALSFSRTENRQKIYQVIKLKHSRMHTRKQLLKFSFSVWTSLSNIVAFSTGFIGISRPKFPVVAFSRTWSLFIHYFASQALLVFFLYAHTHSPTRIS